MKIASLKKLINEMENEVGTDYQVWMSLDEEEGNELLPMFENPELCQAIDNEAKKTVLFPSHH